MTPVLEMRHVRKAFIQPDGTRADVINIPSFLLAPGEQVALHAPSGTGKSTLLNLIAGILPPDGGDIIVGGTSLPSLKERERDRLRALRVGYVFQAFNLLQSCSALENVLLAMHFGQGADEQKATDLLRRVGLGDRLHHRPRQLSAGQQQRVAVARAVANRPVLVLADEPTGNLDRRLADATIDLLVDVCHERGASLFVATHDGSVVTRFDRAVSLDDISQPSDEQARDVS